MKAGQGQKQVTQMPLQGAAHKMAAARSHSGGGERCLGELGLYPQYC